MHIFMTGIDHSTAPVAVRERFSFTSTEKRELMTSLSADPGLDGCILLNTCNRTELWVTAHGDLPEPLHRTLCRFKGLSPEEYGSCFTEQSDETAVTYLFEVTAGLHSRIIGEDQILAQVKKALDDARDTGCCGSVLEVLFRSAVTGAKKVKTQLSLSTANASAVELAIARLTGEGMDFSGKKCLVIGNGEMGKRAATALIALGADVTVTIRQYRSGIVEVVPGCRRINYTERYEYLPNCDILVSATSSPNYTITAEALSKCPLPGGLTCIDLAVPRDIQPEAGLLPGITLLDIDSFSVQRTDELETQLTRARELLAEQQTKFLNWLGCRDLLPGLDALGAAFAGDIRFRMGETLKALPPEQRKTVEDALNTAADKAIKKALFAVRDESGADTFRRAVEAIEKAF